MQHKLSHHVGWYMALSVLLHLLGISGALQYLRLISQEARFSAPVRVTTAAPELPTAVPPVVEKIIATLTPADPPPATLHAAPPGPLLTTSDPAPPAPPLPAALPPRTPEIDLQPLRDAVTAPVKVPALTTPAVPQPLPLLAPAQPPQVPAAAPSPTIVTTPEPVAPPPAPPTPTPAWRPLDDRPSWEVVTAPRPSVAQLAHTPQPSVKTPQPVSSPPPAVDIQMPNTQAALPDPVPFQTTPMASPPPSAPRRELAEAPIATPTLPPVEELPSAPPAPAPNAPPTPVSPPTAVPQTTIARELSTPSPPPPPATVAVLPPPPSHAPKPQDGGGQSQEVVIAPRLARPAPDPSLPPRSGAGSQTPPGYGRPMFESLPRFVYQPEPVYPLIARQRGWEGIVVLHIELLADGTMGAVKVAESSGYPILDDAARDAVKQWRHIPIKRNDVAVPEWAMLPVRFRLN